MPVVLGIMAASAIAQYMQSEKARGANKDELDKLHAVYAKIQQPGFDESGSPAPKFDATALTPEDYKLIGKYSPQFASYVQEKAPQVLQENTATTAGRSAQMDALSRLKGVAGSDTDPQMQAQQLQASRSAGADAESRNQSILAQESRQGTLGSGGALAAQLQGSSASMDREAMTGQQTAADAYRNRLSALKDSASLGGQIRSDDMSMQSRNADIINSFNSRAAANSQNYQNMLASQSNDAQRYNLDRQQGIANQNTSMHNQYDVMNRQRDDQNATTTANWQNAQKQYLNSLKQQGFGDQMAQAGSQVQLGGMTMGQNNQQAADKNAAINGVGQAAGTWGMASYNNDRADARAAKYGNGYATGANLTGNVPQGSQKNAAGYATDDENQNYTS